MSTFIIERAAAENNAIIKEITKRMNEWLK